MVLAGIGFTALNVTGTENAAKLQNGIVALLLSMLTAFLGFGPLEVFGVVDAGTPSGEAERVASASVSPVVVVRYDDTPRED